MRLWIAALVALAFLAAPDVASAQKAKAGATAAGADDTVELGGVKYKRKTSYDFDDDMVEGDLQRPDGEYVAIKRKAKHSSLIKIREHFIPEMLKSAEDI